MQVPAEAYDIMEKELLPVFAEAVRVCKKISNDEDYFKKGYSRNTLYSMALLSVAIKSVTKDIASDDHKKHNISRIDLLNKRHFYQPDGSLGPSENVFNRKEVVEFKKTMRKMNASEALRWMLLSECGKKTPLLFHVMEIFYVLEKMKI